MLDGQWTDKRGNKVVVDGKEVTWPSNGRSAKIKQDHEGLTMSFQGGDYHAKLVDGQLLWDVDDVWTRGSTSSVKQPAAGHTPPTNSGKSGKVDQKGVSVDDDSGETEEAGSHVRAVLAAIDRDRNGHLNYTEINLLQKAAQVGHITNVTYMQLCHQFKEDPKVGLGVETLTAIFLKHGSLGPSDAITKEAKFLVASHGLLAAAAGDRSLRIDTSTIGLVLAACAALMVGLTVNRVRAISPRDLVGEENAREHPGRARISNYSLLPRSPADRPPTSETEQACSSTPEGALSIA